MNATVETFDGRKFSASWNEDQAIAWIDGNAWLIEGVGDEDYARENSATWDYAKTITIEVQS